MRYTIDRKDFKPKQEKCKEEFMFEVWLRGQIEKALFEIETKQCCKSLERIRKIVYDGNADRQKPKG